MNGFPRSIMVLIFAFFSSYAFNAFALPLTTEYSIQVYTQQIDDDSWFFKYDITNHNQQISGKKTGLDGFKILLPGAAVVTDISLPYPYYGSPGYWGAGIDGQWLRWWGYNTASTYPIGATASFSFYAHNVMLGQVHSILTSYWNQYDPYYPYYVGFNGGRYSDFDTIVWGPVAFMSLEPDPPTPPDPDIHPVPEPAGLFLLGTGLIGIGLLAGGSGNSIQ